MLLQNGCDPSVCNLLGVNALSIATRGGHDKIIDLLFEHDVYIPKGKPFNIINEGGSFAIYIYIFIIF